MLSSQLQALYSPEALRSPRGSTTASRIAAILALRWKRLHISARFFLTKAIFTQDPKKQYELTQALILQAFFSKPLILLLGHTTHSESLANKVLHFSASLPLVVAMVALIHIYMILKPLLRSIQATRKVRGNDEDWHQGHHLYIELATSLLVCSSSRSSSL